MSQSDTAVAMFASLEPDRPTFRLSQKNLIQKSVGIVDGLEPVDGYLVGNPAGKKSWSRICQGQESVDPITQVPEAGPDLRSRAEQIARNLFQQGYETVLLVACDVPELSRETLQTALNHLNSPTEKAYISPSPDGGFNLLGLNSYEGCLFEDVPFFCSFTNERLLKRLQGLGYDIDHGPRLHDVDRPTDWIALPSGNLNQALLQFVFYFLQFLRATWALSPRILVNNVVRKPRFLTRAPPSASPTY